MLRLGDKLREERMSKGLTIEEVAKATKIRHNFIEALEDGNYKQLPSSAYVQGFVKNYIEFLGLPAKELLALFRREFDEREFLGVLPKSLAQQPDFPLRRFNLSQAFFITLGVLLLIFVYIFIQYRAALFNPGLSVSNPPENAVVHSSLLTISGKADPNSTVSINGDLVAVDAAGNFQQTINIFSNEKVITLVAVNSFGRKTTLYRHITVKLSP